MGYLTTFRGLFGNVLETFNASRGLQPKDLLHALQGAIEDRKKILLDGVFVPNHFVVHLSRKDMGEIRPLVRSLTDQLTVKVGEWIAAKGYATLSGTIHVDVIESAEMAEDEVYIEATMQERPGLGARAGGDGTGASASAPVPAPPAARETPASGPEPAPVPRRRTVALADRHTVLMDRPVGQLRVVSGPDTGRAFPVKPGEVTIGRGPGAQLVLQDEPPFVSRAHCTLRAAPGRLEVTDLGSTNGVLVNGKRVKDATLHHLDTVQIGSFTLQFVAAPEGPDLRAVAR